MPDESNGSPFLVLNMVPEEKFSKLKKILSQMKSVLVAYSGGVDSTFLLKVAKEVLGERVLAVTANSPTYPRSELKFSRRMAKYLKAKHLVIKTREFEDRQFLKNSRKRCYFCKKELFNRLNKIAGKNNINCVIDATNYSDRKDFRPGSLAKKQLGVRSPLEEAGLTKQDIRKLSKKLRIPTWNKPSLACLASRIPYGININGEILNQIDKAECIIRSMGFKEVRLRHYNGLARIEVIKEDIPRLIKMRRLIVDKLKSLGYNYITVDLEGYRMGSLNIGRQI